MGTVMPMLAPEAALVVPQPDTSNANAKAKRRPVWAAPAAAPRFVFAYPPPWLRADEPDRLYYQTAGAGQRGPPDGAWRGMDRPGVQPARSATSATLTSAVVDRRRHHRRAVAVSIGVYFAVGFMMRMSQRVPLSGGLAHAIPVLLSRGRASEGSAVRRHARAPNTLWPTARSLGPPPGIEVWSASLTADRGRLGEDDRICGADGCNSAPPDVDVVRHRP
jgi:hypothetical protein